MVDLMQCPFCGGVARANGFGIGGYIECTECECSMRYFGRDGLFKATAAWNRRIMKHGVWECKQVDSIGMREKIFQDIEGPYRESIPESNNDLVSIAGVLSNGNRFTFKKEIERGSFLDCDELVFELIEEYKKELEIENENE